MHAYNIQDHGKYHKNYCKFDEGHKGVCRDYKRKPSGVRTKGEFAVIWTVQ